jgi:tRNA modification GTPase
LIIYIFDLKEEKLEEIYLEVNKVENLGVPFIKEGNKMDKECPKGCGRN